MRKHMVMMSALVAALASFAAPFTDGGVTYTPNDEVTRRQPVVTGVNVTGMVESVSYTRAEVDRRIATNAPVRSVNGKAGAVVIGAGDVGALPNNRTALEGNANFANAVRNVQVVPSVRKVYTNGTEAVATPDGRIDLFLPVAPSSKTDRYDPNAEPSHSPFLFPSYYAMWLSFQDVYSWSRDHHRAINDRITMGDSETLAEAKRYADQHRGGGGGTDTNAVREIVTPMIGDAISSSGMIRTNEQGEVDGGKVDLGYGGELYVGTGVDGGFSVKTGVSVPTATFRNMRVNFEGSTLNYHDEEKRDLTNNVCDATSFGEWVAHDVPDGITLVGQPVKNELGFWKWTDSRGIVWGSTEYGDNLEDAEFEEQPDYPPARVFTATRQRVAVSNETFTTYSFVTNEVAAAIAADNPAFSNAVLAVELNFATNEVTSATYIAVTNALVQLGFDEDALAELPGGKVYGSVGALLAALAAAVAWMRKKKVDKLKVTDTATGTDIEVTADNGVADVADFFKESNSLLDATIRYAVKTTDAENRSILTVNVAATGTEPINVIVPQPTDGKVIDFEVWVKVTAGRTADVPQINYGYMVGETFTPVTLIAKGGENPAYEKDDTLPVTNIVHFTSTDASGYTVVAAAFK